MSNLNQSRVPKGVSTAGRFAPGVHSESTVALEPAGTTIEGMDGDYRVGHKAPTNDGYSNPIDRLADSFGADVYEHPEYHGSGEVDAETMRQLLAAKADPNATVRIYRAVPPGNGAINNADWVSLSEEYAREHAIQDSDPANDWPQRRLVRSDGGGPYVNSTHGHPLYFSRAVPRAGMTAGSVKG